MLLLIEMDRSKQDCLRMTCPTSLESLKPRKLVKLNNKQWMNTESTWCPFFYKDDPSFFKKNQEMGE
jgi:hypothetical protein